MKVNSKVKITLLRVTTVPISLKILLRGQLRFLNQHFHVIGLSSPGKDLIEVEKNEGIKTIAVPIHRDISIIKDIISFTNLFFVIRRLSPTIIHANTPKGSLLSLVAAKILGVPIRVYTITGLRFETEVKIKKFLLLNMERLTCWAANYLIAEGEGVKKTLLVNSITKKRLTIIGNGNINGIDIHYFSPSSLISKQSQTIKVDYGIRNDDFVFVFIGRLVKDKGIVNLIEAFTELNHFNGKIKLLLVGSFEHDLDPIPERILEIINTNESIITVGFQNDIRPFLDASNALIFPSYREGFPNVPMQAGCFGLPSIVSDINGCNEIIIHEQNGLIVPARNTKSLLIAMRTMIEDVSLYAQMKFNARRLIVERYEQKALWDLLLKEYYIMINDLKNEK
jgi:glycosyltransferase involved in cell wall biosynthesis